MESLEGKVLLTLNWGNGFPVYTYGAVIALAALACFILFMVRSRRIGRDTAALSGCLMTVLGVVFSRVLYYVLTEGNLTAFSFKGLTAVSRGGFSMFGALGGMILGAWLGSLICKKNAGDTLDALAPCLMLFVLIARCAEWNSGIGISRELTEDRGDAWLFGTVFAYTDNNVMFYLRTYLFETETALVLFIILVSNRECMRKKSGNLFLRFMILFGATQVIWESLRRDGHMRFNFTGAQHIMGYTMLTIAVVILAVRCLRGGKKNLAIPALSLILPVAGAAVGLEFLIDRSNVSNYLLYGIYVILMGGMAVLALLMQKQSERLPGGMRTENAAAGDPESKEEQ